MLGERDGDGVWFWFLLLSSCDWLETFLCLFLALFSAETKKGKGNNGSLRKKEEEEEGDRIVVISWGFSIS
ncbi:hypothetical protein Dimus_039336 [Dionaea muscipula]